MEITEKWLGEIAGWQAMKAARMLVSAGKVRLTEKTETTIRGHVGGEKSQINSGLLIRSRSNVENLCNCPLARRTGQICEHAIAVALASLSANDSVRMEQAPPRESSRTPEHKTPNQENATAPGVLSLFLPESALGPDFESEKRTSAFLKLEAGEPETSPLALWLKSNGIPFQNTPLSIPPSRLATLFAAAANHPRVFVGKPGAGMQRALSISDALIRPLVKIRFVNKDGSSDRFVSFELTELPPPRLLAVGMSDSWLYHPSGDTVHPASVELKGDSGEVAKELFSDSKRVQEIVRPIEWMPKNLASFEEIFQVELDPLLEKRYKIVPCNPIFSIEVSGSLKNARLRISANFQDHSWQITSVKDIFPIEDQQIKCLFYVRNSIQETNLFKCVEQLGFRLDTSNGEFQLEGEKHVLHFFGSGLNALRDRYSVTLSASWIQATSRLQRIESVVKRSNEVSTGSGIDLLAMEFAYEAPDGFRISRSEALRLIRSGQNTVRGKNGDRYVLDSEQCEELEEAIQDVPVQLHANGMTVGRQYESYFLPFASRSKLATAQDEVIDIDGWKRKLGNLASVLRPYQIQGVGWIFRRIEAGQGVLLGDEMGLGKTLQSIAVVQHFFEQSKGSRSQAIVVCPKSLIENWKAEFEKFAPRLRVLVLHGENRKSLFGESDQYDVLITSYSLIVRDLEFYQNLKFDVAVFDEASFVRNPDTETFKALKSLQVDARLALSGTPVENGVRDLWAIFELILPRYLGQRKEFQDRFQKPLENTADEVGRAKTAGRLRRLIRPFFLRRTKREVLKDLPEKIQRVFWCDMSSQQAELYKSILETGREEIRAARRRSGQNGARMTMLTVLLRLRQTCCDMRLTGVNGGQIGELNESDLSGKWAALDEILDGVIAENGKLLIFSQFVSFLQLCRAHLEGRGIGYAYLDGSTQDRSGQVSIFQTDPSRAVFLISLKAGGYGLNLTKADHVILLDPWWNPAVEDQAIDRAHRFGQTRVVNAYRFVMRGTVEERVVKLQEKKRGLISSTVEERAPMMGELTDADLEQLLDV